MEQPEKNQPESSEQQSKRYELLREWGFDVQTFESRARKSMESARGDLSEVTGALRQTMTTTKQALLDLHKARQPVAAELKNGFERAWDEIEKAFLSVRRLVRESRDEERLAAGEKKPTDTPPEA